jgi:tetratricopeptide (TPR) repeat protein
LRWGNFIRGYAAALILSAAFAAYGDDAAPVAAVSAALREGRAKDADDLATAALANQNLSAMDRAYLFLNQGLAREQMNAHESANADFSSAISLQILRPDQLARALFDRGVTFDEMNRTAEAIADYSAALGLSPKFAAALNNRGNVFRRIGKFSDAGADYEEALTAGDDEPEYPLFGLGQIAEAQGRTLAAEDYYRKALAANAQYAPASERLAVLQTQGAPGALALHAPGKSVLSVRPPRDQRAASLPSLRPPILDVAAQGQPVHVAAKPPRLSGVMAVTPEQSAVGGGASLQLGAWRAEADAADGWNHVTKRAGGLLDGLSPQIVPADIPGKGRYYRLRAGPVADAARLCGQLKSKGLACIVTRG